MRDIVPVVRRGPTGYLTAGWADVDPDDDGAKAQRVLDDAAFDAIPDAEIVSITDRRGG